MFLRVVSAIRGAFASRPRIAGELASRHHLLQICHGDEQRLGRLVASERKRDPTISEAEACRRAVERYKADNR